MLPEIKLKLTEQEIYMITFALSHMPSEEVDEMYRYGRIYGMEAKQTFDYHPHSDLYQKLMTEWYKWARS